MKILLAEADGALLLLTERVHGEAMHQAFLSGRARLSHQAGR